MAKLAKYLFIQESEGVFLLYEDDMLLARFTRKTFRSEMEKLNRSSQWVGSILRLLNREYPSSPSFTVRTDLERLVDNLKEEGLADYLRSKGFKVVKPLWVSDKEIIAFLESKGYVVEGLLYGIYYSTESKALVEDKAPINLPLRSI